MAQTDLISLIICIYNVDLRLFRDCIRSVHGQTLRSSEYEVVIDMVHDDSTSDALFNFVTDLARDNENFVLIQHTENEGLTEARKSGVNASSGKYVIFLDGDDMLTRDALERFREIAHSEKADIVTCGFERWNPHERRLAPVKVSTKPINEKYIPRLRELHQYNYMLSMCGRLIRKNILSPDIFDLPRGLYHDDIAITPRLFYSARSISSITDVLYYYSVHEPSQTGNISRKHIDDTFYACLDWYNNALQKDYIEKVFRDIPLGVETALCSLIGRVLAAKGLGTHDKAELLKLAHKYYTEYPLKVPETEDERVKTFCKKLDHYRPGMDTLLVESLSTIFADRIKNAYGPQDFPIGMEPTSLALRLKGKIVFVCLVDYQLRNAASIARVLLERGHGCVILDNSTLISSGKRQLPQDENSVFEGIERIVIREEHYKRDWLATAQVVLIYNDWAPYFHDAIEHRALLGLPTVGIIEGISDFLRVDFNKYRRLPYRRTEYLLLAGEDDERFFPDRITHVVGLPAIERLWRKEPVFPRSPLAVINVNFTYGVLEWHRRRFVDAAIEACQRVGIAYIITQHPADDGLRAGYPVSTKSQYTLIDEGSLFISRFATGLLESLASGKPVVYFNPHGERVDKFTSPMGAFQIAKDVDELEMAIRDTLSDIENGVDFRQRAARFLKRHTNVDGSSSPTEQTASAILRVVEENLDSEQKMLEELLRRLQPDLQLSEEAGAIGIFEGERHAILSEEQMIANYFGDHEGVMFDVGANIGKSSAVFRGKNWSVHAFEPEPNQRKDLETQFGDEKNLIINSEVATDVAERKGPFYASKVSRGISDISAFTPGHQQIATASTSTLEQYCQRNRITTIDFLNIDVEGVDILFTDGVPWNLMQPEVVLAAFEDTKTGPLGYTIHDMAQSLIEKSYSVYVSEWHPVTRHGTAHDWRRLVLYRPSLELSKTWGNLIAFSHDPGLEKLHELALRTLAFSAQVAEPWGHQGIKPAPINIAAELKSAKKQIGSLEQQLSDVSHSTSWKITAPLRMASIASRKVLRRVRRH
jgi:FkbM family methyltransferase